MKSDNLKNKYFLKSIGSSENINMMNKNLDVGDVPVTEAANKLTAQETTELKNLVSSSRDPQVIASYLAAKSQQESLIEDNNVKNDNLSEASYGGAYDIEDDMYFTKDDLLDFTDELIDTLHDKGIVVDLVNMYMTDGNRLVIAVEDEYGNQIDTDEFIDMRKIRRPKDIYKYKNIFIKDILSQYDELKSFNEDLDEIPVVDRLNFINKRRNGMPGITNISEFIDCLNSVGKDKFMVKETKVGSNLSLADLKDEWMTLKKKGWKWYTKNIPGDFLTYYVFEKINKGENMKENLVEDKNSYTLYDIDKLLCVTGAQYLGAEIPPAKRHCINEINIPHNMRYKYFKTTVEDYKDTIVLNWITQEPFNAADFEVFIKEVKSAFNQIIEDINYKKPFKVAVNVDCRDENCKKTELLTFNKNNIKENLVEDDLQQLKAEVENEVEKYMTSEGFEPDEVKDYSVVDVYFDSKERDTAIVEVRAELSYDGLFELGLRLNKIVADYDEEAYFEPVEPGITNAYIHNITPEKINKRSKQIKEDYEDEPNYINDLYEILIQAQVCIDKIKENYSSDVYDIIKFGIEQNLDEFMAHDEDDWTMFAAIKESQKSPEDDEDEELTEAKNKYCRKKSYLKEYQKSKFYKPYRYDINKTVKDYLNELIVDVEHTEDAKIRFINYLITDKGKFEIGLIELPYDSPIYGDAMVVIPSFDYQWSGDWDSALEIYDSITKKVSEIYDIQTFIDSIDGDLSPEKVDKILRGLSKSKVVDLKESKSIKEDIEDDNYYDDEDDENNNYPKNLPEQFYSLYDKLNGDFWTRKDELKQDIEKINDPEYSVEELNDEYVIVTDPEDDMHALQIFNGGTERTYVLDFDRIRYL